MGRLSEKQLLILTIGITVLLTGGLAFLIWSDLKAVDEEEERIAQIRAQIEAAEREIAQIPVREYQVIADREMADKEVAFLPAETEIETFWEVIERFGDEAGVRITEIASSQQRNNSRRTKGHSSIQEVPQILSLSGTTEEFLRFINLIENYDRIINVVQYTITAGKAPSEDGVVRHSIRLALKTFTYSKNVANTIVSINKYEEKREHPEVKQRLGKIKIQERETYTLRTSIGRRDPFVDIRRRVEPTAGAEPEDREAQEAILLALLEDVRSLREGLQIEEHLRKISDLFRLAQQIKENREHFRRLAQRMDETQRDKLISDRELQERFREEVLNPFLEMKDEVLKGADANPRLVLAQVQEWHERIAKSFDERDWKQVQEQVRDFMDLSKQGKWVEDDARSLALEIQQFLHRAKVIQEFEKRKIVISTILYSPHAVSVAVINGKQLTEGDALDADGRVLVVEIGENYVIFETEGVEIKKAQN